MTIEERLKLLSLGVNSAAVEARAILLLFLSLTLRLLLNHLDGSGHTTIGLLVEVVLLDET